MSKLANHGFLTLIALGIAFSSTAAVDDKDELKGLYEITSGEKGGEAIPQEEIKGSMVRISDDAIVVTDKNTKEVYAASYKLDDKQKPRQITMTSKLAPQEGIVAKGLIEKDGDTVKLIYALPTGETPTEFKAQQNQLLFVMKRVKE